MTENETDTIQPLQAIWFNRLKEADLNLRLAQDRLHDAITDLKPSDLSGLSPFRQASQAEVAALREYERVLRIVRDVLEQGKVPAAGEGASQSV